MKPETTGPSGTDWRTQLCTKCWLRVRMDRTILMCRECWDAESGEPTNANPALWQTQT